MWAATRATAGLAAAAATSAAVLPCFHPASKCAEQQQRPVRVGVIADVQHADLPDGYNFDRTTVRHYRGSLENVPKACAFWNTRKVDLIAQLGDAIDGQNKGLGQSERALSSVLRAFDGCDCRRFLHCIGNHELYNFSRADLRRKLHTAPQGFEYYSVEAAPGSGWRVVVLDPYQEALIGWEDCPERKQRALEWLRQHNPNDVTAECNWTAGLHGNSRCQVPYNGGFGPAQLAWLQQELAQADARGERVLVLSHVLLHPKAGNGTTMAWDFDRALEVLAKHDCVAVVLCGHDHQGGFHRDDHGVLHLTAKSPLNLGSQGSAFAVVELAQDSIELQAPAALEHVFAKGAVQAATPMPSVLSASAGGQGFHRARLALRPRK